MHIEPVVTDLARSESAAKTRQARMHAQAERAASIAAREDENRLDRDREADGRLPWVLREASSRPPAASVPLQPRAADEQLGQNLDLTG